MAEDLKDVVRSQFGVAAADYATSDVHAKGESLARIVELAAPQRSWRVLDVATGAGHMAAAFAPHVAEVIASDITDEMLSEAQQLAAKRKLGNMSVAPADAGAMPFAEATFDLVCCRLAAHHFPDLMTFIREVRRVLKAGGRFALVDNVAPDRTTLPEASKADRDAAVAAYNAFEKLRDPSHGFAPPPSTWFDLLEANGFRIVAREQFGKEMGFTPWVTRMRCSANTIAKLEQMLTGGSAELRHFLKPRRDSSGEWHFSLQELLVVADKNG